MTTDLTPKSPEDIRQEMLADIQIAMMLFKAQIITRDEARSIIGEAGFTIPPKKAS